MKIELESINISSFQNIAENQFIEFGNPGLYGLIGNNIDDGGSNASGKSAFTRAITTGALGSGYVDITNKGLKNRILGINPNIIEKLKVNGKSVEIDRTIGGKLSITVDGIPLTGKTEEIQSKFISILGVSPEHFIHLTHKMQGQFGGFLLMKDSDKKDFLGSFFDTSKLDKASEQNKQQIDTLNKKSIENAERFKITVNGLNLLKIEVDVLNEKVAKYTSTEFLSSVASKKSELTHKEIELNNALETTLDAVLQSDLQYKTMVEGYQAAEKNFNGTFEYDQLQLIKLNEQAEGIRATIMAPVTIPAELNQRLSELDTALNAFKAQQLANSRLTTQKTLKEQESHALKMKVYNMVPDLCNVCGQSVTTEIFLKIKDGFQSEIKQCEDAVSTLTMQLMQNVSYTTESDLNSQKNTVLSDIAAYKANQNKEHAKSALTALEYQISIEVKHRSDLQQNLKNTKNTLDYLRSNAQKTYNLQIAKLQSELGSLKTDIQILEKEASGTQQMLKTLYDKYQIQLNELNLFEASISKNARDLLIHSTVSEILSRNGFVGYIFDSILEEINSEVNENIKQIPVISRLSMYYTPDKTIKTTGAINKSITSNIFDDGEEISFETLSGSERQNLLAADDAAVDTVLCNRLGVDINYKILDEQFGWVDGDNKEHLLEFIKNKYKDKIVLIVDHGSELNAALDNKITVTKQNGIATVSCQSII